MNTINYFGISLDEKLKQVLISNTLSSNIQDAPTQSHTIEAITGESGIKNEKVKKKIFRIKKFVKYNKLISDLFSEEDGSESEKLASNDAKRIFPCSKVNFSKLKEEEKDNRLKNLAKLVKRLRRRVRNLEHKVKVNPTKLLNKYLWNKLGINHKNKYLKPEYEFDFEKIIKALKKIRNHDNLEFNDQKHIIENIINFIANDTLKLDSLAYKKICSLLRIQIPSDKVRYISKKDSKVTISFPETEVVITNKEYLTLVKFKDNEDVLRAALGMENPKEMTIKIIKVEPIKDVNEAKDTNPIINLANANLLWMLNNNPLLINPLAMAMNNSGFATQSAFFNNEDNKKNNMFLK
jgi:hypothetical protein